MDAAAWIGLGVWVLLLVAVAWDEARREQPPVDDHEARRAFDERTARELSGREA